MALTLISYPDFGVSLSGLGKFRDGWLDKGTNLSRCNLPLNRDDKLHDFNLNLVTWSLDAAYL